MFLNLPWGEVDKVFSLEAPYKIVGSARINILTNRRVGGYQSIYAIQGKKIFKFSSIKDCAKSLNMNRNTIARYLDSGKEFQGFIFSTAHNDSSFNKHNLLCWGLIFAYKFYFLFCLVLINLLL